MFSGVLSGVVQHSEYDKLKSVAKNDEKRRNGHWEPPYTPELIKEKANKKTIYVGI